MKTYSLSRRLIVTVLFVETLLALCTTGITLLYERHQHMRTFDVMLRGRADSLLGAVQDAEDEADNVILAPKSLDLQRGDLYQVREPSGHVLGQSPEWNGQINNDFHESMGITSAFLDMRTAGLCCAVSVGLTRVTTNLAFHAQ